jgi:hypothetical protein
MMMMLFIYDDDDDEGMFHFYLGLNDVTYNARTVFPEWILKNSNWRGGEL